MNLGQQLVKARKKNGMSQEEVAEKLGVSRQTISKWELDETVPDIYQVKKLAVIYHMSLDKLIEFDVETEKIKEVIDSISEETNQKIDWNKMWSHKYPVLQQYKTEVETEDYAQSLKKMLQKLKNDHGYDDQDAFLVLKDILASIWNNRKG